MYKGIIYEEYYYRFCDKFVRSIGQLTEYYDIRLKIYNNGKVEVRKYYTPIKKNIEGYDNISSPKLNTNKKTNNHHQVKEIRKDNLARSRQLLIDYCYSNEKDWYTFITLTFKDNITDLSYANKKFNIWVSKIKRKYPSFKYLCVPEFQKRGAVHYHLITNLKIGSEYITLQDGKDNMYDVKYWKYGFSSVFDIKNKVDEQFNIALYLLKYMYKDIDNRLFSRKKIMKSNNLEKPHEIKYLSKNPKYIQAMHYLYEKGYHMQHYSPKIDMPYMIPYSSNTFKLVHENFNIFNQIIKDILSKNYTNIPYLVINFDNNDKKSINITDIVQDIDTF